MDPVTHTLVGASLAAKRLGSASRGAVAALVIGANLPDVDVLSYFGGGDHALGFRRGWTHGVPALVVLPALLTVLLWLWHRRRAGQRAERPFATRRVLALSYLACATHPALDWLNTYGMRWWLPFSDRWTYGDSVFIMDPWIWLLLGGCWLLGRRPRRGVVIGFALVAALLLWITVARAPAYTPLVATVMAVLLAAMLLGPPGSRSHGAVAGAGLLLAALYIGGMIGLHAATEGRVRDDLAAALGGPPERLLVGPMPADPSRWDVVAESGGVYRFGTFDWRRGGALELSPTALPAARGTETWARVEAAGLAPGFRRWVRFPWLEREPAGDTLRLYLLDARYTRRRTTGFGGTVLELPLESESR